MQPNFESLPIPQLQIARALNRLNNHPRQSCEEERANKAMDARSKLRLKLTFFRILPLTTIAGATVYCLMYFLTRLLEFHLPRILFAVLFLILFGLINKKYSIALNSADSRREITPTADK